MEVSGSKNNRYFLCHLRAVLLLLSELEKDWKHAWNKSGKKGVGVERLPCETETRTR